MGAASPCLSISVRNRLIKKASAVTCSECSSRFAASLSDPHSSRTPGRNALGIRLHSAFAWPLNIHSPENGDQRAFFADAVGIPIDIRSLRFRHFRGILTRMALRHEGLELSPIVRAGKTVAQLEEAREERAEAIAKAIEKAGLSSLRLYDLRS